MAHDHDIPVPPEPKGAPTLEEIADANPYSNLGQLARQLQELRKRVEALEHYAGGGLP